MLDDEPVLALRVQSLLKQIQSQLPAEGFQALWGSLTEEQKGNLTALMQQTLQ
jgi:hypothetical protein